MLARFFRIGLVFAVLYFVNVTPSDAIPAFARKYQFSCSTCHAPFPRLKPFGEEFAARGFRLEAPSQEPTRAFYDVGDPWLQLPREFPLALRLDGYASLVDSKGQPRSTDVEWPWSVKLLTGGQISKKISYYAYGILEKGETIKLEDTWVQFRVVSLILWVKHGGADGPGTDEEVDQGRDQPAYPGWGEGCDGGGA